MIFQKHSTDKSIIHNTLITILSDMGTPSWLLKLVMALLEERKIVVNHRGCPSNEESLPIGGPSRNQIRFIPLLNPNKSCRVQTKPTLHFNRRTHHPTKEVTHK